MKNAVILLSLLLIAVVCMFSIMSVGITIFHATLLIVAMVVLLNIITSIDSKDNY